MLSMRERVQFHLQTQGLSVVEVHAGRRRGQYQIVLGPLQPKEAMDQLVFVQDTLKTVFTSHGYFVTMLQTPVEYDESGG